MQETFEYDVFLSFANSDEEIVKPIWQELCLSGLRVFWSDAILKNKLGESWFETIESSLERSRHFVLICSASSMSSEWVKREYRAFYNHCFRPRVRRLIAVLIGDYQVSALPLFLRELEACRLNDPESIKRIAQILGGVDIEHLRNQLSLVEEENKQLRNSIDILQLELGEMKQERVRSEQKQNSRRIGEQETRVKDLLTKIEALRREVEVLEHQTKDRFFDD